MNREAAAAELKMDPATLYREELFSDQKIGTIRRLTPVDANGADDPSRTVRCASSARLS